MGKWNREQVKNLAVGVTGVFVSFCTLALLYEQLLAQQFENVQTKEKEKLQSRLSVIFFPALFTWILGAIYNKVMRVEQVTIPLKNSLSCSTITFVSKVAMNIAVIKTSYPTVAAAKSSNILIVILVSVFCTRVRDKSLNLHPKKIIIALIIAFGVIIFIIFDPETAKNQMNVEITGLLFALVTLTADAFLADFQAEIKVQYKPEPTVMMVAINKYEAIISFIAMVLTSQLQDFIAFSMKHSYFFTTLTVFSLIGFVGQIFIYRLIKQFKQHIVPVVVTVRKIVSVFINILYFGHETSLLQLGGMAIVSGAMIYQFSSEIQQKQKRTQKFNKVLQQIDEMETDRAAFSYQQSNQTIQSNDENHD